MGYTKGSSQDTVLSVLTNYRRYKQNLESMSRGISYMKQENGRLTGLVTSYVETAFYNKLLKER